LIKVAIMGAARSGKTRLTCELAKEPARPAEGQATVFMEAHELMAALLAHLQTPNLPALQAALAAHQAFDFTLICGLDLDTGLGSETLHNPDPRTQEAQDDALRACLTHAKLPFAVVYGQGRERTVAARRSLDAHTRGSSRASQDKNALAQWHLSCENCSDAACERAMFTGLLKNQTY
jgi:hypothetical protein